MTLYCYLKILFLSFILLVKEKYNAILCFAEFGIFLIDPIAKRNFSITSQEKILQLINDGMIYIHQLYF